VLSIIKQKFQEFSAQEFFRSLLWAIIIAIIFRTFLFEPFRIPSGSMIPTLQIGDYLFTSKFAYGFSRYSFPFGIPLFEGRIFAKMPTRGDIIVFKGVKDPETFYIKRLIGLPGDEIQVKHGILYINNQQIPRELKGGYKRVGYFGEERALTEYIETIEGIKSYSILQANGVDRDSFPDETSVYKVPEGQFFFMGDNRNHSVDSRYLNDMGYVPFDRLVGRADYLLFTYDFSPIQFFKNLDTGRAFSFIK
jgi:signal peptidase I